jgi:hypothetical protein
MLIRTFPDDNSSCFNIESISPEPLNPSDRIGLAELANPIHCSLLRGSSMTGFFPFFACGNAISVIPANDPGISKKIRHSRLLKKYEKKNRNHQIMAIIVIRLTIQLLLFNQNLNVIQSRTDRGLSFSNGRNV